MSIVSTFDFGMYTAFRLWTFPIQANLISHVLDKQNCKHKTNLAATAKQTEL